MSAVTALSKNKYTIKANSTTTINFLGSDPNYYYIVNGGNTALYVGISMMPTEDFYDAKIPSASSKLCLDTHGHKEIYIYNPSIEDANIIVTSFEAPFEAETLAMSGLGQDMNTIELSGEFDAKGDLKTNINHITELLRTNLELLSMNPDATPIDSYLARMESILNIMQMCLSANPEEEIPISSSITFMLERLNIISEQLTIVDENGIVPIGGLLNMIRDILEIKLPSPCTKYYMESNTDAEQMYTFKYIKFISNDSETDLTFVLGGNRFTLKAQESLTDILLEDIKTLKIPKNSSYRVIGG